MFERNYPPDTGKRKRMSRSRVYGNQLLGWLRWEKKRKGYSHVTQLIDDIQLLTKMIDPESISVDPHFGLNAPKRRYSDRQWSRIFRRICKELQRHKAFPQLTTYRDGQWFVEWCSNTRKEWLSTKWADCRGYAERPISDTDAVMEVVRAVTDGYIELIRRCARCGEWFGAGLKTQVYCSRKCQRQHYWSSASWKAHRREYMRRYRRIKSLPNIK